MIATDSPMSSTVQLRRDLQRAERRKKITAIALIAPLLFFLLITFVVPIGFLLERAIENPEIADALPKTVSTLAQWDRTSMPAEASFAALADDLLAARERQLAGGVARRINAIIPGARSIIMRTARALPLPAQAKLSLTPTPVRDAMITIAPEWGQLPFWQVIAQNGGRYSSAYLLAALDLRHDAQGNVVAVASDQSAYRKIFGRTFLISFSVAGLCLLLGFPLAYWLSTLSERRANLMMILVLIPFWTSILVRVAAWMVLLQSEGLVNKTLEAIQIIQTPLELLFNRTGTLISMTHILLPFMILPLYSVMKSIPPTTLRAAISLGSHPFAAYWRVYVPQTYPGVGAGALLVFILALGYYITPALLGGPNEQMVSYYVAYFINVTINWGMACALGALLFAATLVLYSVYRRFAKIDLSMG